MTRVKSIYPNVPEKTIKECLKQINITLTKYESPTENIFPLNDSNLKEFLNKTVLPIDAGVLHFAGFRTEVLEFEESLIQDVLIDQYFIDDIKPNQYIAQEPKIISHLNRELKSLGLEERANKARYQRNYPIKTKTGNFNFDFAWKNGIWNLVKPVGFDLKSNEAIIAKARHNLGDFTDLYGEIKTSEYKSSVIVGRPTDKKLFGAYDKALLILEKSPNTDIVEENDLKQYSEKIIEAVAVDGM
ncbi:MAG: hypothetical protein EOO07_15825 [Chitinophagaceae bacterium]|nr:MAG: hypothetical protein EOO07_15825 [Chitinophagaceae bacterium]